LKLTCRSTVKPRCLRHPKQIRAIHWRRGLYIQNEVRIMDHVSMFERMETSNIILLTWPVERAGTKNSSLKKKASHAMTSFAFIATPAGTRLKDVGSWIVWSKHDQ
jgi:hypothetical protein